MKDRLEEAIRRMLADDEAYISKSEANELLNGELTKPSEDVDTRLVNDLLDILEDYE